jgi:putative oxidoreductase
MKINYAFVSRSLIALLFVFAGVQKLMEFSGMTTYIGSLGVPLATIVTALVIVIEIPVALAFAWGYRVCAMGSILIGFTILTILVVHHDLNVASNIMMALKNIAIIGGIMATIQACGCEKCKMK